nr:PREDICTED: uncharacterized protein LOC108217352 [Daucus carota subsp. sativus]
MASKRSKVSRGSKRSKADDRISQLPDSLLLMILSSLSFQSAVRTSVLSKRWKPLYMSLPSLDIDNDFPEQFEVDFINSIDRVLMNRPVDLKIQQFDITFYRDYDPKLVNQWVHKALQHQVEDLSLFFLRSEAGPRELIPDILLDIPDHVSFSTLKALRLTYVMFSTYESVGGLLLHCPVLEDFSMEECEALSGSCLAVRGSSLKNLKLTDTHHVHRDTKLEIVIDAPGLQTLEIGDFTRAEIVISVDSTFLSLRKARIDVGIEPSLFRLFNNIYHVKCLTLDNKAIRALEDASEYCLPTFHNLIQLELLVGDWSCWNLLPNMLASSPKLQTLLLTFGVHLRHTSRKYNGLRTSPKVAPECLSSHLKMIDFRMFHGTYVELSLVEYMLWQGKVLKGISILFAEPWQKTSRIREKVESFSRASKTCKIEYHIHYINPHHLTHPAVSCISPETSLKVKHTVRHLVQTVMAPKRSKASRGSRRSKADDRISQLPDSVLLMILSLLSFESAVRTSVLSKRWRPLYMSLPSLLIDDDKCPEYFEVNFINSIDRVLMERPDGLKIQQLGLSFGSNYDPTQVNQWVDKALKQHGVEDLSLSFDRSGPGPCELLPGEIYTNGGLQNVAIRASILLDIPDYVSFPELKVLRLACVTFSSYESIEDLLLDCPVLEEFSMEECNSRSGSRLVVCGSSLKKLKLRDTRSVDRNATLKIVIDAPGLETLEIVDSTWASARISIASTFLSLREARIDVGIKRSVFQLFNNIYHVKCLTLDDKAIGVLDDASEYCLPTFHNLVQLELLVDNWSCWKLLPNMLASSPKLQTLLLTFGVDLINTCRKYDYGLWTSPKVAPECLASHLTMIDFGMFHGTYDELYLLEYMLWQGKVLRKVSILWADSSRKTSRIRKEVESFSRASKTCKIEYLD